MGRLHCCHPRALVHGSPLLAMGGRNSDRLDIQCMGRAGPFECLLCRRNADARSGPPCGGNLYPRAIRATPPRQSHAYLRALGKVAFGTAGGTIRGVVGLLSSRRFQLVSCDTHIADAKVHLSSKARGIAGAAPYFLSAFRFHATSGCGSVTRKFVSRRSIATVLLSR